MDGGDGAGGPVGRRGAFVEQRVQLDLEIRVAQLGLVFQVGVCEAERRQRAEAGSGQRAAAGRQRPPAASRRTGQRAG